MTKAWLEVHIGEFICDKCGARWVGRWNGPKHLMTCLACKQPMHEEATNE